jgi:hypothetical protein
MTDVASPAAGAADPELAKERAWLPVGSPVKYWPGYNQHVGRDTVTGSEVTRSDSGSLVVEIDGAAVPRSKVTKRFE